MVMTVIYVCLAQQEEEARSMYSADSDSDDDTSPVMKTREVPASQVRTRIQGYLFASDIKVCTGICLGDVPVI